MIFVNNIGEIVHSMVDRFMGAANKVSWLFDSIDWMLILKILINLVCPDFGYE